MDAFKLLLISLSFLSFLNLIVAYSISCTFLVSTDYKCEMYLYNEEGFDNFIEINGYHETGKTNAEVKTVEKIQRSTTLVPFVICNEFRNLEIFNFPNAGILQLTTSSFYHCLKIKSIDLKNNLISSIHQDTFARSSLLVTLDLDGNKITQLSDYHFTYLTNLVNLRLSYNQNLQLADNVFHHLINLKDLRLSNCYLSQWRAGWFSNLLNIERVLLNDNYITSIPVSAFHPQSSLIELGISYNNIEEFNRVSFGKLDRFQFIAVRYNLLTAIDQTFFNEAIYLQNALFAGNPCGGRDYYNFQSNKVTYMAELQSCFNSFSDGPWIFNTNGGYLRWRSINAIGLYVSVKAASDAQIMLTESTIGGNEIEVVIGANGNTKSIMRENEVDCSYNPPYCPNPLTNVLSANEYRNFTITWHLTPYIYVTRGGPQFLTHNRTSSFRVNYFAVNTLGTTGEWIISRIVG